MRQRLYFDYCATTPVHPQVLEVMMPALTGKYGNASSLHSDGQQARELIEIARRQVAEGIGADPEEIYFTSGATEGNNLALLGVMRALPEDRRHLITSEIEHHAVLHTTEALSREGYRVTYLPVDEHGFIDLDDLRSALDSGAGLVSVMYINNEVGSVQPIKRIGELTNEFDVIFHTDAVQAVGYYNIDINELGVDLLTLSAHKIYGPKGVGALYIRKGTPIEPIIFGGTQEGNIRPGTENVPGIVGLGAAMDLRNREYQQRFEALENFRNYLIGSLHKNFPDVKINGSHTDQAPHVISISFPGADGELLLYHLDQAGISVSMGSACTSEEIEPSHVLTAMKLPISHIEGTLRISLGIQTSREEIDQLVMELVKVIEKSRF